MGMKLKADYPGEDFVAAIGEHRFEIKKNDAIEVTDQTIAEWLLKQTWRKRVAKAEGAGWNYSDELVFEASGLESAPVEPAVEAEAAIVNDVDSTAKARKRG